jgi:hypothetical protein
MVVGEKDDMVYIAAKNVQSLHSTRMDNLVTDGDSRDRNSKGRLIHMIIDFLFQIMKLSAIWIDVFPAKPAQDNAQTKCILLILTRISWLPMTPNASIATDASLSVRLKR